MGRNQNEEKLEEILGDSLYRKTIESSKAYPQEETKDFLWIEEKNKEKEQKEMYNELKEKELFQKIMDLLGKDLLVEKIPKTCEDLIHNFLARKGFDFIYDDFDFVGFDINGDDDREIGRSNYLGYVQSHYYDDIFYRVSSDELKKGKLKDESFPISDTDYELLIVRSHIESAVKVASEYYYSFLRDFENKFENALEFEKINPEYIETIDLEYCFEELWYHINDILRFLYIYEITSGSEKYYKEEKELLNKHISDFDKVMDEAVSELIKQTKDEPAQGHKDTRDRDYRDRRNRRR